MLLENRLQLVCNIHEENQHHCWHLSELNNLASLVLWGEKKVHSCSIGSISSPLQISQCPLYGKFWFYTALTYTHAHAHTCTHTQSRIYLCSITACSILWECDKRFISRATQKCRKWMQRHVTADAGSHAHKHTGLTANSWHHLSFFTFFLHFPSSNLGFLLYMQMSGGE